MTGPNAFAQDAIRVYLRQITDYALLVSGPWGSGKTHQVRAALKAVGQKFLYLSANGATSLEDLNLGLVVAARPYLGTKFAKMTDQIVTGLLTRIKVDIKFKLSDFAKVPSDAVIIIDDVERALCAPSVVLAFSNSLVEHDERKVILIAAENEIKQKFSKEFALHKEKVVGRQIAVKPDPSAIIRALLYRIVPRYQKFVLTNEIPLIGIFAKVGHGNLRTFKRFLFDFSPIFEALDEFGVEQSEILRVCQVLLAFTLPARRNHFTRELIERRPENQYFASFEESTAGSPLGPMLAIGKLLPEVDIYDQSVSNEFIIGFVFDGFVDEAVLARAKSDLSIGTDNSNAEPWRVLWRYLEIDEDTFAKSLREFLYEFFQRKFVLPGEILHAFGILYELSGASLLKYTDEQVSEMCEAYADEIVTRKDFDLTLGGVLADHRHGSAYGLGIRQLKNVNMVSSIAYLRNRSETQRVDNIVKQFRDAVEHPNLQIEVINQILVGSDPATSLSKTAFLTNIRASSVAEQVVTANAEVQSEFFRTLAGRYEFGPKDLIATEIEWLRMFHDALEVLAQKRPDLTKRRIAQMMEWYLSPLLNGGPPPAQ